MMNAKRISVLSLSLLFSMLLFGPTAGLLVTAVLQIIGAYALSGGGLKGVCMAVTAYAPCTEERPAHTPGGECLEEGSGIIGLILIKKGFNISSSITDDITFDAAVTAEDIILVKDIEAYWPATTRVTIPGIAGRIERHGHFTYDMPFKHEGVDANLPFWNHINNKRNYGCAYVTEEYKAFAPLDRFLEPVLCDISAAPASDQQFNMTRFFQGNVKWKSKDLVYYLDNLTPAILQPEFQV